MADDGQVSGQPSQAMQWVILTIALAIIAAMVVVVVTGQTADQTAGQVPAAGDVGSIDHATTSVGPDTPSPDPTDEAPRPREPAAAVLAALDGGQRVTPSGVAARVSALLEDPALGHLGAAVLDPTTDELLIDVESADARIPASTTKLLTALAALETLGPDTRFRTTVVRTGDHVVLVGGGDPTLSQRTQPTDTWDYPFSRFDLLARATADELAAAGSTSVRLAYADDLFSGPSVNPAWETGYVSTGQVAPVSALSLDGGRIRPGFAERAGDPASYAADRFAALLGTYGVQVPAAPTSSPAPDGVVIASVQSPTVAEIVGQMLARSDNDVAEMLARHVARAEGIEPTFSGAGRAISAVIGRLGLPTGGLELADGSGLSRQNRIAPITLAHVLEFAYEDADGSSRPLLTGLPVAGFTGSLGTRFDDAVSKLEAGDIRAKTGFLTGVVALAGYVVDTDGRPLIFVTLADAVVAASTLDAQLVEDQLAARLAGCGCS